MRSSYSKKVHRHQHLPSFWQQQVTSSKQLRQSGHCWRHGSLPLMPFQVLLVLLFPGLCCSLTKDGYYVCLLAQLRMHASLHLQQQQLLPLL